MNPWYARYTLLRSARFPSRSLSPSSFSGGVSATYRSMSSGASCCAGLPTASPTASATYRSMSSGASSAFANVLIPSIMALISPNALLPTSTVFRPKSSMWLIAHTVASGFSIMPPLVFSPVSSSLSSRTFFANAWNVPTSMPDASIPNSSSRLRISPAALSVNVRHSISSGLALPRSTRWRTLSVSTMVLPLPGPATMSSGPPSYSTAALCSSLSFASIRRAACPSVQKPSHAAAGRRPPAAA